MRYTITAVLKRQSKCRQGANVIVLAHCNTTHSILSAGQGHLTVCVALIVLACEVMPNLRSLSKSRNLVVDGPSKRGALTEKLLAASQNVCTYMPSYVAISHSKKFLERSMEIVPEGTSPQPYHAMPCGCTAGLHG